MTITDKQSHAEIGILGLQGGVQEHVEHLQRIGLQSRSVKHPGDLEPLSGLILPGGESSCLASLLRTYELDIAIRREHDRGLKIWGTCAGAILLADEAPGKFQPLGLIDIAVTRNAFGSQLDSFCTEGQIPAVSPSPLPLTFIRAPKITRAGQGVEILLRIEGYIVAAETRDILVTVFHPELTPSTAFHRYFARKCGLSVPPTATTEGASGWNRKSWTAHAANACETATEASRR